MSKFVEIDSMERMRHHLLEGERWQQVMNAIETAMQSLVQEKVAVQISSGALPLYMVKEQVYATNPDHGHAKAMRNWHQSQAMLYAQVTVAMGMGRLIALLGSVPASSIPQQR